MYLSDILAFSLPASRHTEYVDQQTRLMPHTHLNHEKWHQGNMFSGTEALYSKSVGSLLASSIPSTAISSATLFGPATSDNWFHSTKTLLAEDTVNWVMEVKVACGYTLSALHSKSPNFSSVSVCYNVRTFNGIFQVYSMRTYGYTVLPQPWANGQGWKAPILAQMSPILVLQIVQTIHKLSKDI